MASSTSSKGNNMMRLKQENQSSIRKIIYLRGPVLRSSIAEDLHLTLPTITTNVNAMLQSGSFSFIDRMGNSPDSRILFQNVGRIIRAFCTAGGYRAEFPVFYRCGDHAALQKCLHL